VTDSPPPPPTGGGVELRRLETAEQAGALVDLHRAAFPDTEATRLGPRYLRAFFEHYRSSPSAIALVAWRGAAIGYVVGSPHGSETARYRALLPAAVAAFLARPRLGSRRDLRRVALWRLASLRRATARREVAELPRPVYVLDLIGVDPSHRGQCVGALLLEAFVAAARARGARSLVLWARHDAVAARRLYERHGWRARWEVQPDRTAFVLDG
jgi:ribosomal protein S18 acetylase RimI-like enzyme